MCKLLRVTQNTHLTRILLADTRISSAHHIVGDHLLSIICIFNADIVVKNRNFDLLQNTGWFAVFLQCTPTSCDCFGSNILFSYTYGNIYSSRIKVELEASKPNAPKGILPFSNWTSGWNSPFLLGKQIGRMKSVMGTRSFKRSSAMSLSKLEKLNCWEIALRTNRVSGRFLSSQRSCSPNVTLIMNHINLKQLRNLISLNLSNMRRFTVYRIFKKAFISKRIKWFFLGDWMKWQNKTGLFYF